MRKILSFITMLALLSASHLALAETQTQTTTTSPASAAASPLPSAAPAASAMPAATAASPAALSTPANSGNGVTTQQIETTVHQYLQKQPEVVVEALQSYQQKQMESMQQLFKETQKLAPQYVNDLFHNPKDPVAGNANGKVTLVEFSDYQCSHCIEVSPLVDAVIKANPSLRIVVKEFPIRGGLSDQAARAALAANKQGKYWAFRDALFKAGSTLSEDKIYEVAKAVGLNVDQLKKDMNDKAIRDQVIANQKLAMTLKLVGTPAFFIAKTAVKTGAPASSISYIPGILTQDQLQTIITQMNR